jgi:conflict system STAND superfamily ATPase
MKTPFKLLDAFELKDHEFFFGRDDEVKREYRDVLRTRLLMIYGLSGTGKTSVIQCGLAGKFDVADWFPMLVRPGDNINHSLAQAIAKALKEEEVTGEIIADIKELTAVKLRPIYIIIDQFEEFFTLTGNTREVQDKFMNSLRRLLDTRINCRVILIMREEYIAQLYPFESIVPELFNFRFRIERMNTEKVKEVIKNSFGKFNIHLEGPVDGNLDLMVRNIAGDDGVIDLPYLQIYLDTLYQKDYLATYGDKETSEKYPRLDITRQEIEELGQIEDVLSGFLDRRMRTYYRLLKKKYNGFPQKGVSHVLDLMVTEKGTKKPILFKMREDILIPEFADGLREEIHERALSELINGLSDDRIIRINPDSFELAHDSLAAIIADRRTDVDKQLQFQFRRILNAYDEFLATDKNVKQLLTSGQLIVISPFLKDLNLKEPYLSFVRESQENVEREVREEEARRQRELDERDAKIEAQKDAIVEKEKAEKAKDEAVRQGEIADKEREKALDALKIARAEKKRARLYQWLFVSLAVVVAGSLGSWLWSKEKLLVKEKEALSFKKNVSDSLEQLIREIPEEIKRIDSLKLKHSAAPVFIIDGSFISAKKVSNGIAIDPTDTFMLNEQIWFLARIVVDREQSLYAQVYKGDNPVRGKNSDFRVVPNPIGYRVWNYVQLNTPGSYKLILSANIDGATSIIGERMFYVVDDKK